MRSRVASAIALSSLALLAALPLNEARAGNFVLDWNTLAYPAGVANPPAFVLTDQYGFQTSVTFTHTGTFDGAYPAEETGGIFGTQLEIDIRSNAGSGLGGFGDSSLTSTMSITQTGTGTAVPVNGLNFRISDIDPSDLNGAAGATNPDRCDFITATGNAGNPTLSYVTGAPTGAGTNTSFLIGPSTGTGTSGTAGNYRTIFTKTPGGATNAARTNLNFAANQAHCLFYPDTAVGSTNSNGDDIGTLLATYPNGTSSATITYDEVVENAKNNTVGDPAQRGIGVWSAVGFTVPNTVSLVKASTTTVVTAVGQVVPYTFTVTNNGPLPILTTQNIIISDAKITGVTCPAMTANIASGGTLVCTGSYTTTAADVAGTTLSNTATAGVGTGAQTFATRLQSNTSTVNIPVRKIDAVNDTFAATPVNGVTGGSTTTVFVNDTVDGVAATPATVTNVGIVANGGLTGVTISTAGLLTVPAFTPAGSYNVQYRICNAALNTVCDIATAIVAVSAVPQQTIAKTQTSGPNPITAAGQTVGYGFTVTNTGNVPLTTVLIADQLLQGATPQTLTSGPTRTSGDTNSNNILDIGEAWVYAATYTVTQAAIDNGTSLSNTASVDTDQTTLLTSNAVVTPITQTRNLTVLKTATPAGPLTVGQTVTFNFLVTNIGNTTISGVTINETVFNGTGGTGAVTPVVTPVGASTTLAPNGTVNFTASYVVTQADVDLIQ